MSGQRIPVEGPLHQQAPIVWVSGGSTRVEVVAHMAQQWLRGQVLASQVRFVIKKGTRLYSGPTGVMVGLLTDALKVVPRTYQKGRVSFEFQTPTSSNAPSGVLLWARAASFRYDAKNGVVPAQWSDKTGTPLDHRLVRRLDDLFYLFVEEATQGMLSLSRCANAAPRIRLLERRGDKLKVTVRPADAYTGRPGPILFRGWIYLKPQKRRTGRTAWRSGMYCARRGRSARVVRMYGGGKSVTTRPLPIYLSPHPGHAPLGVLFARNPVRIDKATLVRSGPRRFLKVQRQLLFYVPYHPRYFRKKVAR